MKAEMIAKARFAIFWVTNAVNFRRTECHSERSEESHTQ